MSKPDVLEGPHLKVMCDEQGQVTCGLCLAGLVGEEVNLLVREQDGPNWIGVCLPCTKLIAGLLTNHLAESWVDLIDGLRNRV